MTASEILKALNVPFDLIHMKDRSYVDHLLAVEFVLGIWGEPATVRLGGLLHSIYGTERFQGWKLDHILHRQRVSELVGADAEALAYANCALVRDDFDAAIGSRRRVFRSRFGGDLDLSDHRMFRSLCVIQLCDWLDQVVLTGEWDYRLKAYGYMAEYLDGAPKEAFWFVYRNHIARRNSR